MFVGNRLFSERISNEDLEKTFLDIGMCCGSIEPLIRVFRTFFMKKRYPQVNAFPRFIPGQTAVEFGKVVVKTRHIYRTKIRRGKSFVSPRWMYIAGKRFSFERIKELHEEGIVDFLSFTERENVVEVLSSYAKSISRALWLTGGQDELEMLSFGWIKGWMIGPRDESIIEIAPKFDVPLYSECLYGQLPNRERIERHLEETREERLSWVSSRESEG